jgi:AcrR family transcriptional regulator
MPRSAQAEVQFHARERRIIDLARSIAESEGWAALTVRRLADAIGFSQPILYRHFPGGRDEIVERVVIDGYAELAAAIGEHGDEGDALRHVVIGYLDFASRHPRLYEAMASAATSIVFASSDTPQTLRDGFAVLERAVAPSGGGALQAELLWSLLHGVSQLGLHGRLAPALDPERVDGIVALFAPR